MADNIPDVSRKALWAPRLSQWTLVLAIGALVIAATGLTLARYDMVGKLSGFSALLGGGLIAAVALIFGLLALFAGRGVDNGRRGRAFAGIAISLLFVGFLVSRPLMAGDVPAIHDVTTDLDNPPQFEVLPLRPDNLVGVGTVENWRRIHAAAYASVQPVMIAKPVAQVTEDAVRLARESGWEIAVSDPARGHVEATASVSYIRFKDDVVIRITPTADGSQSRVDMRSVSRVGVSDFGVNARRIEDFLKRLSAS